MVLRARGENMRRVCGLCSAHTGGVPQREGAYPGRQHGGDAEPDAGWQQATERRPQGAQGGRFQPVHAQGWGGSAAVVPQQDGRGCEGSQREAQGDVPQDQPVAAGDVRRPSPQGAYPSLGPQGQQVSCTPPAHEPVQSSHRAGQRKALSLAQRWSR
eukprot:1772375-Prymnesium_polylepis.1